MEFAGAMMLALLLGLRHGLDWDHVSALADITGSDSGSKRQRVKLSLWYAIGHETMVCLLGGCIILFAWSVPVWVDNLMSKTIGLTLIVLAVLLLVVRRHRPYLSRGVAIFQSLRKNRNRPFTFTKSNVFLVGIIHGVGAETPTQLLLFTTIAGMTAQSHGIAVVVVFCAGLLITHLAIAIAGIYLHDWTNKIRPYFPLTVYASAALSFLLGFKYLLLES
ncbi:hypothetical protein [Cohnella cholangitidis]|uniref:Nickel/cobalt efflux system n=1 Tax=Cohnella cholangitidis TaxID=2598458 RepID=A0A7G5C460_9BACL|nr:hypothetical protein [Cohnella cholangitidis]QMV43994.1 hypothetical protein FPL14_24570 [Cohnella cholangitidis]